MKPHPCPGVCLLIGDLDDEILYGIGTLTCSLEMGGLPLLDEDEDDRAFRLPLETKYYSAEAVLWVLKNFSNIKSWEARHTDENICSLIIFIRNEIDISYLHELGVYRKKWDADVQVHSNFTPIIFRFWFTMAILSSPTIA